MIFKFGISGGAVLVEDAFILNENLGFKSLHSRH